MKKLLKVIISLFCIGVFSINILAKENDVENNVHIQYVEDGSYYVTQIVSINDARTVKKGQKHSSYYNSSGKLLWKLTVIGTFSYNGSSSTCIQASCQVTNIDKNWSLVSKSASKTGNIATGKATMHIKGGGNTTRTVKLTCSKNGTLS